ncbi:MAG: PDZ domain-containing protein [Acidimicrobiia bacterium]
MADDTPDQEQPTMPVETPAPSAEPPTEAISPTAAVDQGGPATPPASAPAEQVPSKAPSGPRWAVVAVLALVLGIGGGFLLGRATAPDEGPTSLADAVSETAKGDLPVGQLDLQELIQSIGKQKGGALGQILGGGSDSGSSSDQIGGLIGGLLDNLRNRIEHGGSGGSSSDSSSGAVLGVKAAAAPSGQTGVLVQEVAAGSAAADGGLQANDLITAVDGDAVTSPAELGAAVQSHDPGDQVTITYTRGGTTATATVRLGNGSSATTTPPTTQAPTNA